MVLVSDKPSNDIGILQTKLGNRETNPDALGWKPCHWARTLKAAMVNAGFVANLHLRRFVLWSLPVTSGAQRGRTTMAISFKGAHFPQEIILMGVRW
jgi:hypothetical protein